MGVLPAAATSPPVTGTTTDVPSWANLPSVVVGAILALLASLFVQAVVVPRIEARKRREQRWESDLRDLGELLTSKELTDAARAARNDIWFLLTLRTGDAADNNMNADQWADLVRRTEEEAKAASRAFSDLVRDRIRWLVSRVVPLEPDSSDLRNLNLLAGLHRLAAARRPVGLQGRQGESHDRRQRQ
jgi:hypothetical protein